MKYGPWNVVLAILVISVVLVVWFPLLTIGRLPSINYNEGWNAYRQSMAAEGQPLYAAAPRLWITNYPFLSFHLVGIFGAAIGNMVLAGRIVSAASTAVIAGLTAGIVRAMSGSARAGLHAGLCLVLWVATFTPERRAMNDPELLGAAFAALGLFAYVRAPESLRWLGVSALAFAVGMFVKQDLLALPASVAVHLVATKRWRTLAVWAGIGALSASSLLGLTVILDGRYFAVDLFWPRAYLTRNLGSNLLQYILHFGVPLAVCLIVVTQIRRNFLLILLLITNLTSIVLSGGDGVASNIFYPSLLALAIASGVTLGSAQAARRRRGFVLTLVVPVLAGAIFVPFQLHADLVARRDLPVIAADARRTTELLRSAAGPAICEDLLLCYDAGKPIDYDPFFVGDQIATGRITQDEARALLTSHHYAAVQIDGTVDPSRPLVERRRFATAFMQTLQSNDRLVSADGVYAVFEPR